MRTARECGVYVEGPVLLLALELSAKTWRLCIGANGRQYQATMTPGDAAGFEASLVHARARLGLPANAPVVSCYEAGRDGFWVHRWLTQRGVGNVVVDSASIEVSRRARQVKTDRVDARKLLALLARWYGGDGWALAVARVPSVAEEDQRRTHRERDYLVGERTRESKRLQGLLADQGVKVKGAVTRRGVDLSRLRTGDGRELPAHLREELARGVERYRGLSASIAELENLQDTLVAKAQGQGPAALVSLLMMLKGVGMQTAWCVVMELFAWRGYRNRKELAASVGLVPTAYDSGQSRREQGVSKSGNRRVRAMLIELAWGWLRYQPDSALSRWWQDRFAGTPRGRKVGIVALARKLLIDLWKLTQSGVLPEGAVVKAVRG